MSEKLLATTTTQYKTTLTVTNVTGDDISLEYKTMPGNKPKTNGNFVAIWQNPNQIPWGTDPLKTKNIESNNPSGSTEFSELNVSRLSYIIGYSVGTEVSNICSTAFIPEQGGDPEYFATYISLEHLGSTSVSVKFETPTGYLPKTNKNWIGIWRGGTVPYSGDPMARANISIDANEGTVPINNIELHRSTTYSIGYFMGEKQTTLAASVTFTTA